MSTTRCEFYLGELFPSANEQSGYVVELMRCGNHMKEFQRLLLALSPVDTDDPGQISVDLNNDPVRVLVMNFTASQLRESLKIFERFSKLSFFADIESGWPDETRKLTQALIDCVNEWNQGRGILFSILKPLRDRTFHYDPASAREWLEKRLQEERDPRPYPSYYDKSELEFGPGMEFDEAIYSEFQVWGRGVAGKPFSMQVAIRELQGRFLGFVEALVDTLMCQAKIPEGRPANWILKHAGGFRAGQDAG